MAVTVNINVASLVPRVNSDSLTLVIFKNARYATGKSGVISVNTLQDLYDNFETPVDIEEARELYSAEYLLRANVNLLCYAVTTPGTIAAGDITAIQDVAVLDYKMVVVPYDFISDTNTESLLLNHVKANDIQLFMDLEPFTASTDIADIDTAIGAAASAKLELFINAGLPTFTSNYDLIPADFDLAAAGAYAPLTDFIGIPASLAAVVRKASYINAGTPWLPVAGETYGMVNEFSKILRTLSTVEKTALQTENINVLVTKVGVGTLFVSQNTRYVSEDATHPLIRSHVVTEALWLKRQIARIADSLIGLPNISKTWTSFNSRSKSLLKEILGSGGIEEYHVKSGLGVTMEAADIAAGLFKGFISFLPVRVIENATINMVIQVTENSYEITVVGGDL